MLTEAESLLWIQQNATNNDELDALAKRATAALQKESSDGE